MLKRTCLFLLLGGWLAADALAQPFTYVHVRQELPQLSLATASWADIDGDADFDVFLSGADQINANALQVALYVNEENVLDIVADTAQIPRTVYAAVPTFPSAEAFWLGRGAWNDYDNDGDADLLMLGVAEAQAPYLPELQLYQNQGSGSFATASTGITPVYGGAGAWGDYDNDGDADLLLTGRSNAADMTSVLYRNDGNGAFADAAAGITAMAFSDAAWADYDGDGDLDLLTMGLTDQGFRSILYNNDGGAFAAVGLPDMPELAYGTVDWGDYDEDGLVDFVISGARLDPRIVVGETYIYRNTGNGFIQVQELPGGAYGEATFGDYDNDGDLDLIVFGADDGAFDRKVGRIWRNAGGTFQLSAYLMGLFPGQAMFGDYDNDNDLDLIIAGSAPNNANVVIQYNNTQRVINTPPAAPTALQASAGSGDVTFSWDASTDAETASSGLTYNLQVGTAPGAADILSGLVHAETGRRLVSAPGNVWHNRSWTLRNLPAGTYHWSVQAIDPAYAASPLVSGGSFTVGSGQGGGTPDDPDTDLPPTDYALEASFPNPFRSHTTFTAALPEAGRLSVAVYDLLGKQVALLHEGEQEAGRVPLRWNGQDANGRSVAAGVYLVQMRAAGRIFTQKVVYVP